MEEHKNTSDSSAKPEKTSQEEVIGNISPQSEKANEPDLEGELKKLIEENELQAEAFKKMIKGLEAQRDSKTD